MRAIEPFQNDINFVAHLIHEGRMEYGVPGSKLTDWLNAKDFLGLGDKLVNARVKSLAGGSGLNLSDPKVLSVLTAQAARELFTPHCFQADLYFRFAQYRAA